MSVTPQHQRKKTKNEPKNDEQKIKGYRMYCLCEEIYIIYRYLKEKCLTISILYFEERN